MQLSIISLNTWKCEGDYASRLNLISTGLRNYSFDILLGQEVFESEDMELSTVRFLSKKLSMSPLFAKSRQKEREVDGQMMRSYSGLCIWSRTEPEFYQRVKLPSDERDGDRIAQIFTINKHGKIIAIVNTHLTHLKGESVLRKNQLTTIVEALNSRDGVDGIVLCGDLNAEKSSPELESLEEKYGFRSAFKESKATHLSGRAIDHVFFYPSTHFSVARSSILLNESVNGTYPSDHFGLFAQLTFQK